MSHPATRNSREKILIELIEADVGIGFGLVDDAKAYVVSCQAELASHALQDAIGVIADIERRLQQLGDTESRPFHPLLAELRNEIDAMKSAESQ